MPSRIIVISGDYPQHLQIAVDHGFWDFTQRRRVQVGDELYFWVSGGRGIGARAVAISDTTELTDEDQPWEDSGQRTYTHRVRFRPVSQQPIDRPSWGDVQAGVGTGQIASHGFISVSDPTGEQWLRDRFAPITVDLGYGIEIVADDLAVPTGHDLRERVVREVAIRQGQRPFRDSLLRAYQSRCAVTGSTVEVVLEAAHIEPYRGVEHHQVRNGMLLRADLHTLFDLHEWTLDQDRRVMLSPCLMGSEYGTFAGITVGAHLPARDRPAADALRRHRAVFYGRHDASVTVE